MSQTTASMLDEVAEEVANLIESTTPPRNYALACQGVFSAYAIKVTPENLRAWHTRRVAENLIAGKQPSKRTSDIDQYSDAIIVMRTKGFSWQEISDFLRTPPPEGFGFEKSKGALEMWFKRRKDAAERLSHVTNMVDTCINHGNSNSVNSAHGLNMSITGNKHGNSGPQVAVQSHTPVTSNTPPVKRSMREAALQAEAGRKLKAEKENQLLDGLVTNRLQGV